MPLDKKEESYEHLRKKTEEAYRTFQTQFEEMIASENIPEGTTRIQLLEQIVQQLNVTIKQENMIFVGNMIESLDEKCIIKSKKQNS